MRSRIAGSSPSSRRPTTSAAAASAFRTSDGIVNNGDIGRTISIANEISGIGEVQQLGNSTLILSGNNSYSGDTVISAGTIVAAQTDLSGQVNALGAGTIVFDGGRLQVATGLDRELNPGAIPVISNAVTVNAGGGVFDNNGNTVALAGNISGAGELRFTDSSNVPPFPGDPASPINPYPFVGLTILSGDNSAFSGGFRIFETNVRLENALAAGTGAITIDGGTLIAGDTMTVSNTIKLENNAHNVPQTSSTTTASH